MNKIIKVDNVGSVEEAEVLQNLGVDIIGVSLKEYSSYLPERILNLDSIQRVSQILTRASIAVTIGDELSFIPEIIQSISPDYIQFSGASIPSTEQIKFIKNNNVDVMFSGIQVSYDEDPSWILSRYEDLPKELISYFEIDLLGDMENSWDFLKSNCSNYRRELNVNDIIKLGNKHPLLITLDFDENNTHEIISSFSSSNGIRLRISTGCDGAGYHWLDYHFVTDILKVLNSNNS